MKILICGSRVWYDRRPIENFILQCIREAKYRGEKLIIVHGNARGADKIADQLAKKYGILLQCKSAEWERYGGQAGIIRNEQILDEHSDITRVYAFKVGERSIGTGDMIQRARDQTIPVLIRHERK